METGNIIYCCGACSGTFTKVYLLHRHMLSHAPSYLFDDFIRTAFPKFKTSCKSVQTDSDLFLGVNLVKVEKKLEDLPVDPNLGLCDVDGIENNTNRNYLTDTYSEEDGSSIKSESRRIHIKSSEDSNSLKNVEFTSQSVKQANSSLKKVSKSQTKKDNRMEIEQTTDLPTPDDFKEMRHEGKMEISDLQDSVSNTDIHLQKELQPDLSLKENDDISKKTTTACARETDDVNDDESEYGDCSDSAHNNFTEINDLGGYRSETSTEYFCGKIVYDKFCIERRRSDWECPASEPDGNMKVTALETWFPMDAETVDSIDDGLKIRQTYHCPNCDNIYYNKTFLQYHLNKHHARVPFLCQDCGLSYSNRKTLNMHRLHHHTERQFSCDQCTATFPTPARLREHVKTHAGGSLEDYKYKCYVCLKSFKSVRSLRDHVNYAHSLKQKECPVCHNIFSSRNEYLKHRNKCSEKPFVCNRCDKTFSSDSSMRRHAAIHLNHKPHKCHLCNRRFLQKGPFWIHMEKHHDLTKQDLISMFPDQHLNKHVQQHVHDAAASSGADSEKIDPPVDSP